MAWSPPRRPDKPSERCSHLACRSYRAVYRRVLLRSNSATMPSMENDWSGVIPKVKERSGRWVAGQRQGGLPSGPSPSNAIPLELWLFVSDP